jgi:hypothetical protein
MDESRISAIDICERVVNSYLQNKDSDIQALFHFVHVDKILEWLPNVNDNILQDTILLRAALGYENFALQMINEQPNAKTTISKRPWQYPEEFDLDEEELSEIEDEIDKSFAANPMLVEFMRQTLEELASYQTEESILHHAVGDCVQNIYLHQVGLIKKIESNRINVPKILDWLYKQDPKILNDDDLLKEELYCNKLALGFVLHDK